MEITGTLTKLRTHFEEWHKDKFTTLHSALFTRMDEIEANRNTDNDNIKDKLLLITNLISSKLDGNNSQITNINDINTINNKTEAYSNNINLKNLNERLTRLDREDVNNPNNNGKILQLEKKIGENTSSNKNDIYSRLLNLEQTNLSETNIDTRIDYAFEGQIISTNDDLNTYKKPGIYRYLDISDKSTITMRHTPVSTPFSLIVLNHKQNSVRQIINESDNNNIWIRNYDNTTQSWGNWTKLYGEHNTYTFSMEVDFKDSQKTYKILATDIE